MIQLEDIIICNNKIKVMRNTSGYYSLSDEKCVGCEGFDYECPNYSEFKPQSEVPIKKGNVAFILLGGYK